MWGHTDRSPCTPRPGHEALVRNQLAPTLGHKSVQSIVQHGPVASDMGHPYKYGPCGVAVGYVLFIALDRPRVQRLRAIGCGECQALHYLFRA